ncbi:hypothetical protein OIDMADRAFT_46946 [Oidiodendron maius Zn]|uniref:Uncharacterized protein n=1 Tax=Oidiodendron maius (strain Zn) TaxID=913774 RepID=A0A0C3D6S3_OIDMZ|nr:hypothetical protein OIDMADRAFT_46946 [Oidiodendron maius Zn]
MTSCGHIRMFRDISGISSMRRNNRGLVGDTNEPLVPCTCSQFHPIYVTNVLPGQLYQTPPLGSSPALTPVSNMSQTPMSITRLDIPGTRVEIMEYCAWQQKQVKREDQKEDYQKAEAMDLELIYQDQTVADDLRTKAGIKRGIAQRIVGDVAHWAKKYKQDKTLDRAE